MKDKTDIATIELFPIPKKRGRPKSDNAKSGAERQRTYLANKKQNAPLTFTLQELNDFIESERIACHEALSSKKHSDYYEHQRIYEHLDALSVIESSFTTFIRDRQQS